MSVTKGTVHVGNTFAAAHFDGNSGLCIENFGDSPYDRGTEASYRKEIYAEFRGHDRVVSCNPKDWAVPLRALWHEQPKEDEIPE